MNITLDKSSQADGLLTVTLSEADYKPNVDKKIKEYARKATIKGFRKGKVPAGVIQKMYGSSILAEELNNLVSRSVSDYIADSKLKIIGEPLPNKQKINALRWDAQKDFSFEFQLGLIDDFKCVLSSKVKLKSYPIKIDDALIEETICNLQKQFGEKVYPEESAITDQLQGELAAMSDTQEKYAVNLDIGLLKKEEQKKFIGKKKGDRITFDIGKVFASPDERARFLSGHPGITTPKGMYALTINAVCRTVAATLDQALFDNVFGKGAVQSEESFRSKVRDSVDRQYRLETERLLERHIQRYFVENIKIEMPDMFLRTWLKQEGRQDINEEELDKAVSVHKNMLKWDLIKNKIADDLAITIPPEEVKKRARALIDQQYRGVAHPQMSEQLDDLATRYLSDREGANFKRLKMQLYHERVLEAIKKAITVKERPVSLADFRKITDRDAY